MWLFMHLMIVSIFFIKIINMITEKYFIKMAAFSVIFFKFYYLFLYFLILLNLQIHLLKVIVSFFHGVNLGYGPSLSHREWRQKFNTLISIANRWTECIHFPTLYFCFERYVIPINPVLLFSTYHIELYYVKLENIQSFIRSSICAMNYISIFNNGT